MGTHENDPTGAEYFTLAAGVALDDVRDDAGGLAELRAAAVAFLASLPVAAPETWPQRTPDGRGMVWACCVSSIGPTCGHMSPPADVSPLPTIVQWAKS